MPTLIEYVKGVWTSLLPATVKSKMENIEDGVKDACDVLDLETDAGRSMAQAADAAAQRALLNVEDGADVTDEANVTAIVNATAEVTDAPAHWWVLVGGALKRMTQAGWTALVLVATGKTNGATGYTLAGGTTPKTLTVSADADTATIPNATGKSAAENIGGKTGASEAIKLGVAAAEAMETGTATATPNDTDVLPGVKADHSLLKYTWANIKAAIWTALGGLIAGGTAKATPLDADKFGYSSAADSNATRYVLWSSIKSVLATAFKHGGTDEIATATAAANAIPKSGAGSTLAKEWLPAATTSAQGAVTLAADGGTTASTAVQGNDSRLAKAPVSWTPAPRFGGVADDGTRTVTEARAVQIGKFIIITGRIVWSAKGTKTGIFTMAGLPVSCASAANIPGGACLFYSGGKWVQTGDVVAVGTEMLFIKSGSGVDLAMTDADFSATTDLRFMYTYITA